ncbi:MAG: uracil-DNA glycosylase [archaeon]
MKLTDFNEKKSEEKKETLKDKLSGKSYEEVIEMIKNCERCRLHRDRINAVPGEGPKDAKIMLIGEGPGGNEDEQGRPFVGSAGKTLDECLNKAGINRDKVYITNTVRCRPPDNRDPLVDELKACHPYTEKLIELIDPKAIGLLGRVASKKFLKINSITKARGEKIERNGRIFIPTFHPAALTYQPSREDELIEDLRKLVESL